MGVKIDQLQNVKQAIIELQDKRILIENPEVMVLDIAGQKMFYIVGTVREEPQQKVEQQFVSHHLNISNDDIQFVAEYLGIGFEDAKSLLIEAGGDIAKAIEIGQTKYKSQHKQ